MSKRGENIYKRKDNRWEARYIQSYRPDGTAKYGYCYGKTYREAKQKTAAAKAAPPSAVPALSLLGASLRWVTRPAPRRTRRTSSSSSVVMRSKEAKEQ